MICFCHHALAPLRLALPALDVSASVTLPHANLATALANWLLTNALPAPPWAPEPGWASLALPACPLNASAMATISALAQVRAQVLATFNLDLLVPAQAALFAQLAATLQARLSAMAGVTLNPQGWVSLAAVNGAVDRLNLALSAGFSFAAIPGLPGASVALPGGLPMAQWQALLSALAALAPLLAAAAQLGVDLSGNFAASLAAALRPLRALVLPALPQAQLVARLIAALSAVAQLKASLGIEPLQLGLPAVQAVVAVRLSATMQAVAAQFSGNLLALAVEELLALLPALPPHPGNLATGAVVRAAASINAQALASLTWQVPAALSLSAVSVGLPAASLAAQLQAALGVRVAVSGPCGAGCGV